ncbi:MAG: winged helix-turn-helix domain-containing protein [Gammaproteobacteria bacterium]|nr:winged helix-turn-helix domain-containing protein [Gammaproteobacteria bacterium]
MDLEKKNILVVDDDEKLLDLVIKYLSKEGFHVDGVLNAQEMDDYLVEHEVDLFVLDLMLPGEDGLSIARRLRASSKVPILMLSARGEDIDRIIGLEVGADDYLPKPFNPRELSARIKAILRRTVEASEGQGDDPAVEVYKFGHFVLNLTTNSITSDGEPVNLTSGEFSLLEAFVKNPNRVLSRDHLIELIKGYERSPYDRSVDVRVTRLRKKLERNPEQPKFIKTVWGKGYIFTPQGDRDEK